MIKLIMRLFSKNKLGYQNNSDIINKINEDEVVKFFSKLSNEDKEEIFQQEMERLFGSSTKFD